MKEIIYNINREFGGTYIEDSPKYNVSIRIIKFKNNYKIYNSYYLSSKVNNFIREFNNGDLVTIEYPIILNTRSRSSLYSSKICITNERLGRSEDIDSAKLCGFWEFIEEFSIIEED